MKEKGQEERIGLESEKGPEKERDHKIGQEQGKKIDIERGAGGGKRYRGRRDTGRRISSIIGIGGIGDGK